MTDELKTLKDLEMGHRLYAGCADMKTLRTEAIKRWKDLEENYYDDEYSRGRKDFIKDFFNLTEEDLK
ncbi:MAG: hypothetical protein AAB355_00250 [Patescibacteria group bacterium]